MTDEKCWRLGNSVVPVLVAVRALLYSPPSNLFVHSTGSPHTDPYPEEDETKENEKEIIVPRIHEIGRDLSVVANIRGLLSGQPSILEHQ